MLSRIPMNASTTSCPLCGGTGWKPVERDGVREVAPCDCRSEAALARRVAAARIPPRYENCDFASFQVKVHEHATFNESLQKARLLAESFARDFLPGNAELGLLFMGPCGVGKTHLAVAILRALLEKGVECLFCDFRELLKTIQDSYNPVVQTTEMQVLAPVLDTEVLLLDDLGASKPSAWVLDTVGHILNTRYNGKRVTLITTNYLDAPAARGPSSSLARDDSLTDRIGERMRSRLHEMCRTVELRAPDFRQVIRRAEYRFS
jgi:DNA replication protein DnaC